MDAVIQNQLVKDQVQHVQQYIDVGLEKLNQGVKGLEDTLGTQVRLEGSQQEALGKFAQFMSMAFLLWAARVFLLKYLVRLSRSDHAENYRITKRPAITGTQLERESVWKYGFFYDTVAIGLIYWAGIFHNLPIFDWRAIFSMLFLHATVVEFVYYWFHRALHWSWIYKNFHQYHHKSINTEPTTGLSFEIAERVSYTILFAVPPVGAEILFGHSSYLTFFMFYIWFDFMNEGGHINYEVLPDWFHASPLRYVFYSPSFHAVHHTKFKKNFSLFMPWTDILFGTANYTHPASLSVSEPVLPIKIQGKEATPDIVFLVHGGSIASGLYAQNIIHPWIWKLVGGHQYKYEHKLYMYILYPLFIVPAVFFWSMFANPGWHDEERFPVGLKDAPSEIKTGNSNNSISNEVSSELAEIPIKKTPVFYTAATYIVQSFGFQYVMPAFYSHIENRIEDAILTAVTKGVKVVGLGNFNKAEWLNHGGSDIVEKYKSKLDGTWITHGDTLSAAVIARHVMSMKAAGQWSKNIYITGATSKIGRAVVLYLSSRGIVVKMLTQSRERFDEIQNEATTSEQRSCLQYSTDTADGYDCDLWLTGKMIPFGDKLIKCIPHGALVMNYSVPDPLDPALLAKRPDILHLDSGLLSFDSSFMDPRFTWLLPQGMIYACLGGAIVHRALNIEAHEVGAVNVADMDRFFDAAMEIGYTVPKPTSCGKLITIPPPSQRNRFSSSTKNRGGILSV